MRVPPLTSLASAIAAQFRAPHPQASALARPTARVAAHRTAIACALGLVAACAPPTTHRTAPFVVEPGATVAGALVGPFTGRVLDAANQSPVAGAMVYAAWTLEAGAGFPVAAGSREFTGSTNSNGEYTVPELTDLPAGTRVTSFEMLIYKRGFVGYRSDRRFADGGPQHEFAQRGNHILLERWRSEYSHVRHVRYLGGGAAVAALTGWELEQAASEFADRGSSAAALRTAASDRARCTAEPRRKSATWKLRAMAAGSGWPSVASSR